MARLNESTISPNLTVDNEIQATTVETTNLTASSAAIATLSVSSGFSGPVGAASGINHAGYFTSVSASSGITGNLTGNVTGNLTGDVAGNVTGDLTGNVIGNVTGNISGNVTGTSSGWNNNLILTVDGTGQNTSTSINGPGSATLYLPTKITKIQIGDANDSTLNSSGYFTSVDISGPLQAQNFNATSTRAKKKDIKPYKDSALDLLNTVAVVSFRYKNDKDGYLKVGFIAEDTSEVLSTPAHNFMDLNSCTGVLIKAVQELCAENKALKKRIERLEAKNGLN